MELFDKDWKAKTRQLSQSWIHELFQSTEKEREIYFSQLRRWFANVQMTNKPKRKLRQRLQSHLNSEHLGAVNELTWLAFLKKLDFDVDTISETSSSRPDYVIHSPVEFYAEVTTLNVSDKNKSSIENEDVIELDHAETTRRLLGKVTDEKLEQLKYAFINNKPCVLVIYDYGWWSGFGTYYHLALKDHLFGERGYFEKLPNELSAIVYMMREVSDGAITVMLDKSAVYHHPDPLISLPKNTINQLQQFGSNGMDVKSSIGEKIMRFDHEA